MVNMSHVVVMMDDCRVLKDLDRGRLVRRCPIVARVRGGPSPCRSRSAYAHADVDAVDFGIIAGRNLILSGCKRDELVGRALVCR